MVTKIFTLLTECEYIISVISIISANLVLLMYAPS